MIEELSKDIAEWNKNQFPEATLESQLLKLEEEVEEAEESKGIDYLKELVDIFIVASSLTYRFNSFIGKHTLLMLEDMLKGNDKFVKLVEEKMEINRKRKWSFINGTYHH